MDRGDAVNRFKVRVKTEAKPNIKPKIKPRPPRKPSTPTSPKGKSADAPIDVDGMTSDSSGHIFYPHGETPPHKRLPKKRARLDSDSNSDVIRSAPQPQTRNPSTRLPSPIELAFDSPPIESLLRHLDAFYPSLRLPSLAEALRTEDIRTLYQVAERTPEWLTEYTEILPEAADIVFAFALGFQKGKDEEHDASRRRQLRQHNMGKGKGADIESGNVAGPSGSRYN
jgi:hypothetical protein